MSDNKPNVFINYIDGEMVADDGDTKLLVTGKGLMIRHRSGDEWYCQWKQLLKKLKGFEKIDELCESIYDEIKKQKDD